jgi:hypothetical protein
MTRDLRRFLPWLVMLVGCSSQPFCDFQDTAPIVALPVPDSANSAGWGRVMVPMSFEENGVVRDCVAATGPLSQTEVFQLAADGELSVERLANLSEICTRNDSENDETSTCYQRHPGVGLALRSVWRTGESCIGVGMAGAESDAGIGFWCALGDRHLQDDRSFVPVEFEVRAVASVAGPTERIFIGTERSLHVLEGDATEAVRALWPEEDRFPARGSAIDAVSAMQVETDEAATGQLVAVGFPELDTPAVLIGEVIPPAEGEETATLTPRACITVEEPGFGSVLKLARLEPGGPPVLLAGSLWSYEGREPAVHIFDLDLAAAPEDVACEQADPTLSLRCGPVSGADPAPDPTVDVDCTGEGSGFGTSFDVGDLDDTPAYEVVVGSPGATADGFARAGAAFVFRPARDDADVLAALVDSGDERQDAQLGDGVAVVPVGDRAEPVIAEPGQSSLLLFLCTGVGDAAPGWDSPLSATNSLEDPRCRNPQQ